MTRQRRSKYRRPPEEQRLPLKRLDRRDLAILKLYGPEYQHDYLHADTMALVLNRNLSALYYRLQALWHWAFVEKWFPPHDYSGGSEKGVYFPGTKGETKLKELYKQRIKVKKLEVGEYHPFAKHSVLVNRVRVLMQQAIAHSPTLDLDYEFRDRQFKHDFEADKPISQNGQYRYYTIGYSIRPDWFFSLGRNRGEWTSNFLVELQRSSRATKNPSAADVKKVRQKYEAYYYLYKNELWRHWPEQKPKIQNPNDFRVLTICDMKEQEFENLIELVRNIDERKKGLRLFLFIRLEDLENKISGETSGKNTGSNVSDNRITPDSLKQIFAPIWRTPVAGDELVSILT